MSEIPYGYCHCGCGQQTPLATRTRGGNTKGQPTRYIHGHSSKRLPAERLPPERNPGGLCMCGCGKPAPRYKQTDLGKGWRKGAFAPYRRGHHLHDLRFTEASNGKWRGGRTRHAAGYVLVRPKRGANRSGAYQLEHIRVAERILGKPLPPGAVVHHVNGDKTDNRPSNLVICPDHAYHMLLHQRQRALEACGNPDWRRCKFCKQHDAPGNLYISAKPGGSAYHRACENAARRARYRPGDPTVERRGPRPRKP